MFHKSNRTSRAFGTSSFRTKLRGLGQAGVIALVAATSLFGINAAVLSPAAFAADGSLLLSETFSGESVPDARAIGLNDACLTGSALSSTPPGGSSNLSDCLGHVNGTPAPGVVPGWLQLTDVAQGRTGGMVFNRALPSSAGLTVEFDQAQYGGSAADGIGFFLSDGSRELTQTGSTGGALGYGQGEQGAGESPGVAGGYLGVGLDSWGNFAVDYPGGLGSGCSVPSPFTSRVANTVTLRGPGDGFEGYCFLTSTTATPISGPSTLPGSLRVASPVNADAAARNVRVTVSPGDYPTVTVEIDFTGTKTSYQTVLSYVMTTQAPATYKFGFSASTGANTDVHLVRGVTLSSVDSLGDISLIKQVDNTTPQPDSFHVGDTVPYQFVVTNTGDEAIADIAVTDPLISNVTCPATTLGAAGGADASMVCTGTLTVTVAQALTGELLNTATVTALDSLGGTITDSSEVTIALEAPAPAMTLEKSAGLSDTNSNGLADAGETIDYAFLLTNTGDTELTDVSVDDPKAGAVTCSPTTLAPGASVTCRADSLYTVTEADVIAGSVVNTATGNANPPTGVDPIVPPTDTVTTPTVVGVGTLAIEKTGDLVDSNGNGLADLGETINYSFVLTNTGNVTLTGVGVEDTKAGNVTCSPTTLAPGASVTCTADAPYVVVEEDVLARGVINTATGNATTPAGVDPIVPPTDTIVTPAAVPGPSLALEKRADLNDTNGNDLANVGETINYSFFLINNGNVTLTDVGVSDPKAGTVTCSPTTLAPGESVTCTADVAYSVTEADIVAGGVVNTATGVATPPLGTDPIVPPEDTVTTPTVAAGGALSLTKSAALNDTNGNKLADPGETIDYSFLLANIGTVTLTDVSVDDPKAGPVTCNPTTLAPGASVTCTADKAYTVTEADILATSVINSATGNAIPPAGVDPIVPPTDTVTTPTVPVSGTLSLTKMAELRDTNGNGLADLGEKISYSFEVKNTGNVTLTDVRIQDPMVGEVSCEDTTLKPEALTRCTAADYTVTQADVDAGFILNTATVTGKMPGGAGTTDPAEDSVRTATGSGAGGSTPPLVTTGGSGEKGLLLAGLIGLGLGLALVVRRRSNAL